MSNKSYQAGVQQYRNTYWEPDYTPKETDFLACFKISPQNGISREEAAATVAAESSTGTWTNVWTDLLIDLERYKGRVYNIENVPGYEQMFYAYIAYPIDLFEYNSVTNVLTSLLGSLFGLKILRALRLEDIRFPISYVSTCGGPPNGMVIERDKLNKYGRSLLGSPIKPKLGLSAKNYGRAVYECLRGGLDFTKDDESVHSQAIIQWRHRFEFVMEAVQKAEAETGERKGHFLNVTAATPEEMYKRAEFAKELGAPIIMHDYIIGGICANTGLANWCRENGILLHVQRTMHAVIDRHPFHGIHSRVFSKVLRLSGGDHLHTGTVVGRLEAERNSTLGNIDILRESYVKKNPDYGIMFDQNWSVTPGVFPVASGGIHVGHMPELVSIFGDDAVFLFGGATLGHPWGNAAGAAANRIALEACIEARNQGINLETEGKEILIHAAKHSPELQVAMQTWHPIKFNKNHTNGMLDYHSGLNDPNSRKFEVFSYLPEMSDENIKSQIQYIIDQGWVPAIEHTEPNNVDGHYWYLWKLPMFGELEVDKILAAAKTCHRIHPTDHIRLVGYDNQKQSIGTTMVIFRGPINKFK